MMRRKTIPGGSSPASMRVTVLDRYPRFMSLVVNGKAIKLNILIQASLFFFFSSFIASAEVYKWLDDTGRTHFSDRPPLDHKSENLELTEIATYASANIVSNNADIDAEGSVSKVDSNFERKKKVIMYSAVWCGVCKKAKKYFRKNKIPFKEYDIDTSIKGKRDFKKLKASGVPVILVGKKRLNGFNANKFELIYRS